MKQATFWLSYSVKAVTVYYGGMGTNVALAKIGCALIVLSAVVTTGPHHRNASVRSAVADLEISAAREVVAMARRTLPILIAPSS
jgi:hypothetical protein